MNTGVNIMMIKKSLEVKEIDCVHEKVVIEVLVHVQQRLHVYFLQPVRLVAFGCPSLVGP